MQELTLMHLSVWNTYVIVKSLLHFPDFYSRVNITHRSHDSICIVSFLLHAWIDAYVCTIFDNESWSTMLIPFTCFREKPQWRCTERPYITVKIKISLSRSLLKGFIAAICGTMHLNVTSRTESFEWTSIIFFLSVSPRKKNLL